MKRLLFIAHCVPDQPDKGERIRAFYEIRALAERFDVTLAAVARCEEDRQSARALSATCGKVVVVRAGGRLGQVRAAWSLLRGHSASEGFFHSRAMRGLLRQEAGPGGFDLAVGYSSSMLPHLLDVPARARVMDLIDMDSAKWAAYAEHATGPARLLYRREARAVARLERKALERCDAVAFVTQAEAKGLPDDKGKVVVIGNGVDVERFSPRPPPTGLLRPSLVFTGTMDYRPNVQGVCWFVREVWPGVRRASPGATFTIVGRDPAPAVRRLSDTPGVVVTGAVPDVRPYLAGAMIAVCPLRIARGIQNKVLEAMAMGLPVVGSAQALEGLEVSPGSEVVKADSPAEWQEEIVKLVSDAAFRDALGRRARECAVARFSWKAKMAPLVALCERLAAGVPAVEARASEPAVPAPAELPVQAAGRGRA